MCTTVDTLTTHTLSHSHTHTLYSWLCLSLSMLPAEVKLTSSSASHEISPSKTDPLLMVPAVLKYLPQAWHTRYHTQELCSSIHPALTYASYSHTHQVYTTHDQHVAKCETDKMNSTDLHIKCISLSFHFVWTV